MVIVQFIAYDDTEAKQKGRPADLGFSFKGMTDTQRALAIKTLRLVANKLEQHTGSEMLKKHGTGEVLNDEDIAKTATPKWTENDQSAFEEELAEDASGGEAD